jgi:hypothetical protein
LLPDFARGNNAREGEMGIRLWARGAAAACLWIGAQTAYAQPQPQIEIDFTAVAVQSQQIPLSPVLTILIALALAATGVAILKRKARGGRWLGMLLVGLAVAASWPALNKTSFISDAAAISGVFLSASPGTLNIVGAGTYTAFNVSGSPLVLTAVKLNNPGGLSITGGTCIAGLLLVNKATCTVVVS